MAGISDPPVEVAYAQYFEPSHTTVGSGKFWV